MSLFSFNFFADNPVICAERIYQQRSYKLMRRWVWLVTSVVLWSAVAIGVIIFGLMLISTLIRLSPLSLGGQFLSAFGLLCIVAFCYHVYLMFQTMSLAANSISREKQGQTWELLLLTGMDARQIVLGKWWATIEVQLPRYILLSLMRLGVMAGLAIGIGLYVYKPYDFMMLPHVVTITASMVVSFAYTLANLGLSAACGIVTSASSRNSTVSIVRGFGNQLLLSGIATGIAVFFVHHLFFYYPTWYLMRIGAADFLHASISLFDNGFVLVSAPLYINHTNQFTTATPMAPIVLDWAVPALLALLIDALLIGIALWWAQKRSVGALTSPTS